MRFELGPFQAALYQRFEFYEESRADPADPRNRLHVSRLYRSDSEGESPTRSGCGFLRRALWPILGSRNQTFTVQDTRLWYLGWTEAERLAGSGAQAGGFKYFVRGAGKGRAGWCVIGHTLRLEFPGACHHVLNRGSYRIGLARTVLDRSEQIHPARAGTMQSTTVEPTVPTSFSAARNSASRDGGLHLWSASLQGEMAVSLHESG